MKPVTDPAVRIGQHSRTGRAAAINSEYCGATSFVLLQDENERPVTLGLVADGIGGVGYGAQASQWAAQVVRRRFTASDSPDVLDLLNQALQEANRSLYERGLAQFEEGGRLGTMLAAVAIIENRLYVAHVGDSRIYLLHPGRGLVRLTHDHTRPDLERYLGQSREVTVDLRLRLREGQTDRQMLNNQGVPLMTGDKVLLVTDGVTDALSDDAIRSILERYPPDKAAERLTRAAHGRDGRDTASALVLEVPAAADGTRQPFPRQLIHAGLGLIGLLALVFGLAGWLSTSESKDPADLTATATGRPADATRADPLLLPTIILSHTPTATPTPSETPTPRLTATPSVTPTVTDTPTPRPTWTLQPSPTRTRAPAATRTSTPSPDATELLTVTTTSVAPPPPTPTATPIPIPRP